MSSYVTAIENYGVVYNENVDVQAGSDDENVTNSVNIVEGETSVGVNGKNPW